MTNMKKEIFINNAEILTDEQLDNISGGNHGETYACVHKFVASRLKSEFGIKADVNTNLSDCFQGEWKNKYSKDGKSLTHLQVMGIIRQKYPYKNIFDEL